MNSNVKMVLPSASWTKALEDGTVSVPGITWDVVTDIPGAPERFVATRAADVGVGENGLRRYIIDLLKGGRPTAIPAFFGRELMQRNLLVREDCSLTHPKDLAGKTIGSHLSVFSGTGAAVLMVLEQAYDVPIGDITYRMGDPDRLVNNRMGLRIERGPATDEEGFDLLLRGELDALMLTGGPRYFSMFGHDSIDAAVAAHPGVRVLISDSAMITAAYKKSQLYPISDLVVVGRGAVDADPDLPGKVLNALSQANERASNYRDAAEERLAREEIRLIGTDVHRYELGPEQRKNIAAYAEFFRRMGAIDAYLEPEELFLNDLV